jgi:hypothetical protein
LILKIFSREKWKLLFVFLASLLFIVFHINSINLHLFIIILAD